MTRLLSILALTSLTLGVACGVDDLLIGAPCNEDADCPNLSCVQTASEAAAGEPGQCSESGTCIPGQQEGCQADGSNSCEFPLSASEAPQGGFFCCGTGTNVKVVDVAEDGTGVCFDCPSCSTNEEQCFSGDDRCIVEGDAPCGCRLPEGDLLDEACGSDDDCATLVCVRTLEQLEEPNEPAIPDQALEDGQCRPADDPTCAPGQSGCLLPAGSGCVGTTQVVSVDSLEYCCPTPADNTNFDPQVYVVSADQGQVACTACERRACPDAQGNFVLNECTPFSDPDCVVPAGSLCGCVPQTE